MKGQLFCILILLYVVSAVPSLKQYSVGDKIQLECKNPSTGEWEIGPRCVNSKENLSFIFGRDSFLHCGIAVTNDEQYNDIKQILKQEKSMQCRVPISADEINKLYIPLSLPMWGYVQNQHSDVTNHYNFLFHVVDGIINAAAAYPVKDQFQTITKPSIFTLHGPVKWFSGGQYVEFNGAFSFVSGIDGILDQLDFWVVALWCLLTLVFSFIVAGTYYKCFLKPRLIRKYLKTD